LGNSAKEHSEFNIGNKMALPVNADINNLSL